ncbi:MAG: hypothetical protein Q8L45_08000 [Xanthomonadaceae bacterium]|nr:hypothetical protein [Xanthomonadaceae bacterium]MDP2186239.1 hypothetical protein [Xanthomonadales bacterium]MDZ4114622.1 hypothetical protein [Xanthomonadaceae bacterium]MDZ4379526.1 hypothetical protein [Xanthomonadaceae bacterium]
MIRNAAIRALFLVLILAMLGCASAQQTGNRTATAPNLVTPSTAAPVALPHKAQSMYTVTVSRGHPASIPAESLNIELVAVKDDRCPQGVTCIWAGHAAVTLKVGKPGAETRSITIGSEAPRNMGLPYDAAYEGYLLHLAKLEPGNTQSSTTAYRATITVSAGLPKQALPTPNPSEM